ncbi:hypothetical protein [Roseibium sp. M-1]
MQTYLVACVLDDATPRSALIFAGVFRFRSAFLEIYFSQALQAGSSEFFAPIIRALGKQIDAGLVWVAMQNLTYNFDLKR